MIVELFKGRKIDSAYIKQEMVEDWKGALKSLTENDLRRLIIKMLMIDVLEE
jgi:hypothetical protein